MRVCEILREINEQALIAKQGEGNVQEVSEEVRFRSNIGPVRATERKGGADGKNLFQR